MHPKVARALRAARRPYADGGDVVRERATILPLGTYGDGTTRAAWPGVIYEPAAAAKRLVDYFMGGNYRPGDEDATRQLAEDSFTAASAVPVAGLAAAAVRPGTSLGSGGGRIKGYRGTGHPAKEQKGSPPPSEQFWMTGDRSPLSQRVAETYAEPFLYPHDAPAVMAVEARFKNPRVIDAKGAEWDKVPSPYHDNAPQPSNAIAQAAKEAGHDGVIIENVWDALNYGHAGSPSTSVAAIRPGTVFDDYGNQLFSNSSKASSPGLAALESNRVRAYHGTTHEIDGRMRPAPGARGTAVYFSTSPDAASSYATGDAGNYMRFAPTGDHPSVIPADIVGKVFDENAVVSPKERKAIAKAYNDALIADAAANGRKVYPDELMDVAEFGGAYFDRAYPPKGYNVLQALSYEGDEQNALLRALGYSGRQGNAAGLSGGQDIAMFEPNSVRNALTNDFIYSNPSTASVLSLLQDMKKRWGGGDGGRN